jgi:acyl-CoA synthetase (AMP-forming)/AMP-acid ligase II
MASSMPAKAAGAAAATLVAAAGLNSYFGVSRDLAQLRSQKQQAKLMDAHISRCMTSPLQSTSLYTLLTLANPDADAIYFEGRSWTYAAMLREVSALALGFRELGVRDGDVVGVFMTNSPEMVFVVYALTKLGAVPAMMNSNLRDDTLLHCVQVGGSNLVVTTPDIAVHAASAASKVGSEILVTSLNLGSFQRGTGAKTIGFPYPSGDIVDDIVHPRKTMADRAVFIFTSGTTGKPKACSIKNALIMFVSCPTSADCPNEYLVSPKGHLPARIFSCMPIFHGTTFFTGLSFACGTSSCFCIARRFSASKFWTQVREARATRILYVGELCRFLLATPPGSDDRRHFVRTALGNGLQKDVWLAFQQRFGIDEIREFYRSTEGLVKYDNIHYRTQGQKGAGRVGFRGTLMRRWEKEQHIIKFDYDTEQPIRDPETGWCIVAERDEPGEAIAKLTNMATYSDYHNNKEATEKKFLRDVFEKGDVWQRSGDLLVVQNDGWVRFVDRIGDTYRWSGENVSAGEIRGFLSELEEVLDAVVVGKPLTGYDGQAGLATVTLSCSSAAEERRFMDGLYARLLARGVPHYAFPRLIAVTSEQSAVGATFKHDKFVVKAIDWSDTKDGRKYWLDNKNKRYLPLDGTSWGAIASGKAKL